MARRGEAVWRAPHNEPQRSQRVRQGPPEGRFTLFPAPFPLPLAVLLRGFDVAPFPQK